MSEQKTLGFNENEGITAQLVAASTAIENLIQQDLSWVADEGKAELTVSLLVMRYEIGCRLTRNHDEEKRFVEEAKRFNRLFESVDGAPEMKEQLTKQVQNYT